MRGQKIAGVVLILLGATIVFGASTYYGTSWAAYLGEMTGRALALSLIALLVLAITPLRKKTEVVLVLGIMVVASAVTSGYEMKDRSDADRKAALAQVKANIDSQNTFSAQTTAMQVLTDSLAEMSKEKTEIDSAVNRAMEESLADGQWLDPAVVTNPPRATAMRKRMATLLGVLQASEKRAHEAINRQEAMIAALDTPEGTEMLKGFQKTKPQNEDLVTRLFGAKYGLVNAVDKTLEFSVKNAGKFVLKDGQLLFREQASVDEYNRLMKDVQSWVSSEDAITKEALDKQTASSSKIQSLLEQK